MKTFVRSKFLEAKSESVARREDFRAVDFEGRARATLDAAIARGARIERDAYHEGFAQGEKAGREMGRQQMQPAIENLGRMIEELAGAREAMLRAMEGKIARLAIDAAERIVKRKIEEDDTIVADVVRAAIDEAIDRGCLIVRVAPQEEKIVAELRPELLQLSGVDDVRVVADPNVSPGGCLIETESGLVDARVGTAAAELATLFST
ncbi:hypothetical protein K8I61_06595 [bacterium]|nr:hypothetical protein [bacterium]